MTKTQRKTQPRGRILKTSYGEGKFRVEVLGISTKDGLIVCILGGDKPHVGAVALGIPRPSLKDPSVASATSSVFTLLGHKDDEIARPISEMFAKAFKQAAVIIVGVHVEGASEETIAKLMSNSTEAAKRLLNILKDRSQYSYVQPHGPNSQEPRNPAEPLASSNQRIVIHAPVHSAQPL